MLERIHRNIAHSFRRTEIYASSFDTLTQCYLENSKFAREVSVRFDPMTFRTPRKNQRYIFRGLPTETSKERY